MGKEGYRSEIIKFVESASDEENLKIAVFIAGMKAQKNINLLALHMNESDTSAFGRPAS